MLAPASPHDDDIFKGGLVSQAPLQPETQPMEEEQEEQKYEEPPAEGGPVPAGDAPAEEPALPPVQEPVASALLLHGLSDSPYSLRVLGERLHREGVTVLGLRVPGHGTAPVGLVRTRWEDMAAAVALAARHLRDSVPGKPLYVVGYSNGGALAVEYTLSALGDDTLPLPAGVVNADGDEIEPPRSQGFGRNGVVFGLNVAAPVRRGQRSGSADLFAVDIGLVGIVDLPDDQVHRPVGPDDRHLHVAAVPGEAVVVGILSVRR